MIDLISHSLLIRLKRDETGRSQKSSIVSGQEIPGHPFLFPKFNTIVSGSALTKPLNCG
jgi:hypothetical protein